MNNQIYTFDNSLRIDNNIGVTHITYNTNNTNNINNDIDGVPGVRCMWCNRAYCDGSCPRYRRIMYLMAWLLLHWVAPA
jgi:heterodisulfide reductase subunit C